MSTFVKKRLFKSFCVGKYAQLYQKAGCYTAQYILPTRHIFRSVSIMYLRVYARQTITRYTLLLFVGGKRSLFTPPLPYL